MDWERLEVPVGLSVWKDPSGDRIVAAVYVWTGGFEWCHAGHSLQPPSGPEELAYLAGREYFPLFDDEKTLIVGPLGFAQAFLRAVVSSGLGDPTTLTSSSWPSGEVQKIGAWPPIDLDWRAQRQLEVPWDDPGLFPVSEPARMAKYRKLQSRYRHEVLRAKPGASGNYAALGSYLDAGEVATNPQLNFLSPVAFAHVLEREVVVRKQGGTLDPVRLRRNMLSSMPLCFNLFGTMRAEPDFLAVFQELFDPDATAIREITCEWAPQPPASYLNDRTAFDAVVLYDTADGPRFYGIETKYTEPFSEKEYTSPRYDEITTTSEWFANPDAPSILNGSKSNQLWRNLMLAASIEAEGTLGAGRVAVVALSDDPGAQAAINIVAPELSDPDRLRWVPIESILEAAARFGALASWATEFGRRYVG